MLWGSKFNFVLLYELLNCSCYCIVDLMLVFFFVFLLLLFVKICICKNMVVNNDIIYIDILLKVMKILWKLYIIR